jgi:glutathione S-transferase
LVGGASWQGLPTARTIVTAAELSVCAWSADGMPPTRCACSELKRIGSAVVDAAREDELGSTTGTPGPIAIRTRLARSGNTSMLQIYGHPFASFYWKAAIALYERNVPFEFLMVEPQQAENSEAIRRLAPTGQFPVLVDGERVVIESAAIIEYLDLHHGDAPPMVPSDPRVAIEARQMDGIFDDYVSAPLTRMVLSAIRDEDSRDPLAVTESRAMLDKSYAWLNHWMMGRTWAANDTFGIADCSGAAALFYSHWGYPIPATHTALRDYRARLLARPSIARVIDEARPWRHYFPLKGHTPD